jgi:hypothetical protein
VYAELGANCRRLAAKQHTIPEWPKEWPCIAADGRRARNVPGYRRIIWMPSQAPSVRPVVNREPTPVGCGLITNDN